MEKLPPKNCLFLQGPSGSGKTTLARALENRLGWKHLDRDNFGPRPECYRILHEELSQNLPAIVDAPFLYESEEEFLGWGEDLPLQSLLVSLLTPPEERRRRRLLRGLERDQVEDWDRVFAEDRAWSPLPRSLHLPGTVPPEILEEIIIWHLRAEGRALRRALGEDRGAILQLKKTVLLQSFSLFLWEDELRAEEEQVASSEAIDKLLQENEVLLAWEEGKLVALAAISPEESDEEGKRYRKIFSVYSSSPRAGAALAAGAMSRAREAGTDYLLSWVYRDNERSKRSLLQFGFRSDGTHHTNPLVPRVPVEHWRLDLAI